MFCVSLPAPSPEAGFCGTGGMNLENQDYENILNTMPGTGVYVIREEDHGILYFNKKAKEASPEAALGVPCRDVWGGSCAGCPLETMGDRREIRSVGYHDSYGGVVDITAPDPLGGPDPRRCADRDPPG